MGRSALYAWHVFLGLEGRLVARNIFRDADTFGDSRLAHKEPLAGDLQLGLVVRRCGRE